VYPNPQDVLPLPPHPDLDQYRKRAKELTAAARAGEAALLSWTMQWIETLARLHPGAANSSPRELGRRAHQVTEFASERLRQADYSLSQAHFVIARAHGFASWRRLVNHVDGLAHLASDISAFERAADAIVTGDLPTLERLLRADPDLVRARSSREHRATLLHYVSANGVESYRQRTPSNIDAITRYLLEAGAEVDAEADVYGGGQTTLSLVVTSEHPRAAGVQNALADLLLARGARMHPGIVHYCLVNGCPEAGAHLAELGAPVGFVEAAGIGRLDPIRQAFEAPKTVSPKDQAAALVMAAWSGQREVIALLLDLGVDPGARREHDGQTALHAAAFQGDAAMVELLLRHGAPLEVTDMVYGTTPIVWALHAWLKEGREDAQAYTRILLALAAAGAKLNRERLDDDRIRADAALYSALLRASGPE
jgi:ankyrin repeat protein